MPATASQKTIDVKEAVQIASQYLRRLIHLVRPRDIGLEEVELCGENWEITLSFTERRSKSLSSMLTGGGRVYKKFGINKTTGEVVFMRIRKP